jgi:hypothetical protein
MATLAGFSQKDLSPQNLFRIYEDNDGINFFGKGSDWGYTNGMRLDFFHRRKSNGSNFFSRLNPSAGKNSVVTAGWGAMQVMITPKRTDYFIPDKNDYPYSGGLFVLHTVHSVNEEKRMNIQTEWILGVMGPPSLAKEAQTFIHHVIGDPRPNGWDYQLPADLLFNYNLAAEKQINADRSLKLIGGGQVFLGTLTDGLSLYGILRFEKNINSFSGLAGQYFTQQKEKPGFMISLKPAADLILYNALIDGGLFNQKSPVRNKDSEYGTNLERKRIIGRLDVLILISLGNFSISLAQKMFSPDFNGYSSHSVGNVSVCFGW